MKKLFRIGTAAGIPLFLHWTFLLIPAYILISGALIGRPPFGVLADLTLVTVIFACVVLHELGHALAAGRFGVRTKDIILMPIGGIARLERMPKRPHEELIVALAGPAVNVAIAAVLLMITVPFVGLSGLLNPTSLSTNLVGKTIGVNLAMIVFNMLPAFPMDGGRVLRALLSIRIGHLRATRTAAAIGQVMAVLFGLGGLFVFNNPMLIFIAGFVYLGAAQEAGAAEMESSFEGVRVGDVMITRFDAIPAQATAEWTLRYAMAANSRELPVVSSGNFLGMLRIEDLAEAVAMGYTEANVGQLARPQVNPVRENVALLSAIEQLQASEFASLPVVNEFGHLEGLITRDSIRAAQRFGPLLRSHTASQLPERPDELRQHLVRMQVD
jgi:Zn-dependent protease/CBS domain-containing protein